MQSAGTYRTGRENARLARMRTLPCHFPDWREIEARPARHAAGFPRIVPNSGISISIENAVTFDMPNYDRTVQLIDDGDPDIKHGPNTYLQKLCLGPAGPIRRLLRGPLADDVGVEAERNARGAGAGLRLRQGGQARIEGSQARDARRGEPHRHGTCAGEVVGQVTPTSLLSRLSGRRGGRGTRRGLGLPPPQTSNVGAPERRPALGRGWWWSPRPWGRSVAGRPRRLGQIGRAECFRGSGRSFSSPLRPRPRPRPCPHPPRRSVPSTHPAFAGPREAEPTSRPDRPSSYRSGQACHRRSRPFRHRP